MYLQSKSEIESFFIHAPYSLTCNEQMLQYVEKLKGRK